MRFPFPGKVVSLAIDSGTSASKPMDFTSSDLVLRLAEYFLGRIKCKDARHVYSQLVCVFFYNFGGVFLNHVSRTLESTLHIFVDHIFSFTKLSNCN